MEERSGQLDREVEVVILFFEPFCGVFSPGEGIDIDVVDPCFNGFPSSFFSVEPEQDIDLYVVTR